MVRLIGILFFGLLVFGGTAGGIWWWKTHADPHAASSTTASTAHEATDPHGAAAHEHAADEHAGADHASADHLMPAQAATSPPSADLPVAVRPRPMSIEELLRVGIGLNEREESLLQREDGLERQETQLKLALADLRGEQQEIEALRTQVQQQLTAADGFLGRIQKAREEFARERAADAEKMKAFQTSQIQIDEQQRENIKQLSAWIQSMEPDKAAQVLVEMEKSGKLETSVKILSQLEEREVAKILSALENPALVDELITRFQDLKRPEKRTAARR